MLVWPDVQEKKKKALCVKIGFSEATQSVFCVLHKHSSKACI